MAYVGCGDSVLVSGADRAGEHPAHTVAARGDFAPVTTSPAWSPDGTRLAAIDRPGDETTELWTFAADGVGRTVRRKLKAGTSTVRIAGVSRGRHRVTARTPGELVRRVSARSR